MKYRENVLLWPKSDESKKAWSSSTCLLYVVSYVPDFQTKPADDSQAVQRVLTCRFKNEYTVNWLL